MAEDPKQIFRELSKYTFKVQEALKSISIRDYEVILEKQDTDKRIDNSADEVIRFRPTLYDFIAWRAIDYFRGSRNIPVNEFRMNNPSYFSLTPDFIRMDLKKAAAGYDTTIYVYFQLSVLKDLASFHFNDKDPAALIQEELRRFAFVKDLSMMENKDSLYLSALKQFEKQYHRGRRRQTRWRPRAP